MIRSYDPNEMQEAINMLPEMNANFDCDNWLNNTKNIMLVKDGSVGLATYEYDGLYTVHWFFKVHGREALNLAHDMIDQAFTTYGAKAVRGLTRTDIRPARIFARKLGFKSYGIDKYADGEECELFILTKDDFYNKDR